MTTWEACKESINSEDNACTSLISNMDSDSLNEISNESLMDDVNPLFLRVDCRILSNGKVAQCSLHLIPTCICRLKIIIRFSIVLQFYLSNWLVSINR